MIMENVPLIEFPKLFSLAVAFGNVFAIPGPILPKEEMISFGISAKSLTTLPIGPVFITLSDF